MGGGEEGRPRRQSKGCSYPVCNRQNCIGHQNTCCMRPDGLLGRKRLKEVQKARAVGPHSPTTGMSEGTAQGPPLNLSSINQEMAS